ncbi:MAG: 30S ribosomal protein S3 [Pedobacter sp.]|nr:MAG: 30S ribosomal protein S3 [Pedobacter sp.]
MAQKTHPKGFRLIAKQKHLSTWYSNKFEYSKFLKKDYFIREIITSQFKGLLNIAEIEIHRVPKNEKEDSVVVTLHALYPRAKEMYRKLAALAADEKLREIHSLAISKTNLRQLTVFFLQRLTRTWIRHYQLHYQEKCLFKIKFIRNPFSNAILAAKYVTTLLEKRTSPLRAMKIAIQKAQLAGVAGVKVQIAGRINGEDMARTEWKREGKIPLHTLRAKIDYTHQIAQTVDGVLGVRIWLFRT